MHVKHFGGGWDEDLVSYIDVLLNTYGIPQNQMRFAYRTKKVIPRTLVAKTGWLVSREVEYLMMDRLITHRHDLNMVSFAFGLLCSELENTDTGPNVVTASEALLSFAANHPMALMTLRMRIEAISVLLVDMLLFRPTACLAAQWTIMWQTGGRNSERSQSREAQIKTFAVQDALSCIAYHVKAGLLSLEVGGGVRRNQPGVNRIIHHLVNPLAYPFDGFQFAAGLYRF